MIPKSKLNDKKPSLDGGYVESQSSDVKDRSPSNLQERLAAKKAVLKELRGKKYE